MTNQDETVTVDHLKESVEGVLAQGLANPKEMPRDPSHPSHRGQPDDRGHQNQTGVAAQNAGQASGIGQEIVLRVPVTVQAVIGKLKIPVAELMQLGKGSVIELDRSLGEPVDLVINGHLIARGEMLVIDDETKRFGVSLTEIVESSRRT